jgi:hypothetical protein
MNRFQVSSDGNNYKIIIEFSYSWFLFSYFEKLKKK